MSIEHLTAEQQARNLLERMGIANAQSFTAGDLVELANLIALKDPPIDSLRSTLHTTFNDYTNTERLRGRFAAACLDCNCPKWIESEEI